MRLKSLISKGLMPQRKLAQLPFNSIRALVEQKIPKALLSIWKIYLFAHPSISRLWGQEQHDDFIRKTLYLVLYKDLFGIGYDRLVSSVDIEFQVRAKTLRHNTKLIRKILFEWSRKHIVNEGKDVWNAHCSKLPSRKGLHKVNLILCSHYQQKIHKYSFFYIIFLYSILVLEALHLHVEPLPSRPSLPHHCLLYFCQIKSLVRLCEEDD